MEIYLPSSRCWVTSPPSPGSTCPGNQLSALPDSLGNFTALTGLDLPGNQLSALPDSRGNLTALTQLDLSDNQLSAPPSLGMLTR